jgi:hypothetical protein
MKSNIGPLKTIFLVQKKFDFILLEGKKPEPFMIVRGRIVANLFCQLQ